MYSNNPIATAQLLTNTILLSDRVATLFNVALSIVSHNDDSSAEIGRLCLSLSTRRIDPCSRLSLTTVRVGKSKLNSSWVTAHLYIHTTPITACIVSVNSCSGKNIDCPLGRNTQSVASSCRDRILQFNSKDRQAVLGA